MIFIRQPSREDLNLSHEDRKNLQYLIDSELSPVHNNLVGNPLRRYNLKYDGGCD